MAIYMVRAGDSGPVKLGFAADPNRRIAGLQTGQPEKLAVLRIMEGCRGFETALHRHFAPLRIRGEWFTHTDEMLGDLEHLRPVSAANDPTPHAALAAYMSAHGLTDAAVADKLGVSAEAVRLWRTGRRPIAAKRAMALSRLTAVPCRLLRPDIWDESNRPPAAERAA
jgi:DNA-binding transcriptional regulator YdaS (Cro superfamily)